MEHVIKFGIECKCGHTLKGEMVSSGNYDGVENLVVEPCPECCVVAKDSGDNPLTCDEYPDLAKWLK